VEPLRVLLADDHAAFRGGVRALIDSTSELEVAGEAATGTEAVEQAMSLQPDVILMDIHMPGLNGILATRKIVTRSPHIGVVIFTVNPAGDVLFAGLHAGARGFLLKDCAPQDIVRAIQAVGRGEAIFGPPFARPLMEFFTASNTTYPHQQLSKPSASRLVLTPRGAPPPAWTTPEEAKNDARFRTVRWVLWIGGLFVADVVLLLLWAGGTSLDDDCEAVDRASEQTADDWACTRFVQEVGPYAIVPLGITLGLTLLTVVREMRRTRRPA
jgi:DNA-binding NarL/FixJ family response regulator